MKLSPLILSLLLAVGSFAYGRHHYLTQNMVTGTIGNYHGSVTNPLADKKLFGDWMKDQWFFAIALPSALIAGGVALTLRK